MCKNIFNSFLILTIALILTGCEISKVVDMDFPSGSEKVVLIGLIGDSSLHSVYVAKTQKPFQYSNDSLQDLDIRFYESNIELCKLEKYNSKIYQCPSDFRFLPKQTGLYHFEMFQNGKHIYSKPVSQPQKVKIESVEVSGSVYSPSDRHVKIVFNDPQGANYYALRFEKLIGDDFEVVGDDDFEVFSPYSIFDDCVFNGKQAIVTKKIKVGNYSVGQYEKITLRATLFSISKETYNFYWSVRQNSSSINDFYNESSEVATNIVNGVGNVGIYTSSSFVANEL